MIAKAYRGHPIVCAFNHMTLPLEYKNSHFYHIARAAIKPLLSEATKGRKLLRENGCCITYSAKGEEIEFLLSKGWTTYTTRRVKLTGKDHPNSKAVYVVRRSNTKDVRYFENVTQAAGYIQASVSTVFLCCEHIKPYAKEHIAIYDYDFEDAYANIDYRANLTTKDVVRISPNHQSRKIYKVSLTGEILQEYPNAASAVESGNITNKMLYNSIKMFRICNGVIWCKASQYEELKAKLDAEEQLHIPSLDTRSLYVRGYNESGELIVEFDSIKHAFEAGYGKKGIRASAKKKYPYKDLYWEIEPTNIVYKTKRKRQNNQ